MDVLIGSGVVLVGAVAIAVICMALWGLIRSLGDGKFVSAGLLLAGLIAAGYYGKQGYAWAGKQFTAVDLTVDLRSGERVNASEWSSDLKRLVGRRNVCVVRPDGRELRMLAQTVELRKYNDAVYSVWLCSDRLISDDAADLVKQVADELKIKTDGLDAWADRRRHAIERDAPGWSVEQRGRPYTKLTIDTDGNGFWWVGVLYAK